MSARLVTVALGAPSISYRVPDSVRTVVYPDGRVVHENPDGWIPPVSVR